ncbi:hypothetical protein [Breznakia pachnodae]|uniref:DUF4430 domain-containing protein n=1 Tax=Breznakia pachnodae TaxID=265178 RepID=A0ABU0E1I7_9FIRM|nr:hypothetical protein [Breznakia pachnodae]MDQ0360660.1 hypothetical protein [Breznakia pachnodae]
MKHSTRKTLILILFSIVVIVAIFAVYTVVTNRHGKVIHVTIIDDKDDVVYDEDIETTQTELDELLTELNDQNEIKFESGSNEGEVRIVGLGEDTLIVEDQEENLYWNYYSENNVQCLENNGCDTIDKLVIEDGDDFIFRLEEIK